MYISTVKLWILFLFTISNIFSYGKTNKSNRDRYYTQLKRNKKNENFYIMYVVTEIDTID